jgi:glutathione-regulated potassium-efflux system ancillary protein KefG
LAIGLLKRLTRRKAERRTVARPAPSLVASTPPPSRAALLVLAHPALHRSRVNAALIAAVHDHDQVTLHDLYQDYPDFLIDVAGDQKRLVAHRLIVLQFPMYWYSTPALLKEWLDMVLLHGFAHGRGGTKLQGKTLLCVITAGGSTTDYHPEGMNRFSMEELLRPLEATAHLCGLVWTPPFIVHDSIQLDERGRRAAAEAYRARLEALIEATAQPEQAAPVHHPAPTLVRG